MKNNNIELEFKNNIKPEVQEMDNSASSRKEKVEDKEKIDYEIGKMDEYMKNKV